MVMSVMSPRRSDVARMPAMKESVSSADDDAFWSAAAALKLARSIVSFPSEIIAVAAAAAAAQKQRDRPARRS